MPTRTLKYELAGDASGLERAMARARAATSSLTGNVERSSRSQQHAFRRVEHEATRVERSFHHVHSAARSMIGATGLAGVAFGLKDITSEALKAQAEQVKLSVAVKNAGINWHAHGKAVEESVKKMSLWSGFAKSDVSAALANMIRTTHNLKDAHKDLGIAMDIARTKGLSLGAAQQLVARAALDNTRGLKSLGINIENVTTAHDKLKAAVVAVTKEIGNSHGATKTQLQDEKAKLLLLDKSAKAEDKQATRKLALNKLDQAFHGQAKKYASSTAGQFDKAKAALTNMEEEVGAALLPALSSAAKEIAKLARKFTEHWPEIKKSISDTVGPVWSFAKGVASFVSHHKGVQKVAESVAAIAVAYKTIHKLGELTGLTKLLGAGGKLGGGIAGKVIGSAKPIPVYVVNEGWGKKPGGMPGGGGAKTVEKTVEKDAVKAESRFGRFLGRAAAVPGLKYLPPVAGAGAIGYAAPALARLAYGRYAHPAGASEVNQALLGRTGDASKSTGPVNPEATNRVKRATKAVADYSATVGKVVPISDKAAAQVGESWGKIQQSSHEKFGNIKKTVTGAIGDIKDVVGTKSAGARDALGKAFSQAADAVRQRMRDMGKTTKDGLALVQSYTVQSLKSFGLTDSQISGAVRLGAGDPSKNYGGAKGHAAGGYIGARGQAGGDNIPIMVGAGEAVLNRHQQAPVETALRMVYGKGLGELFSTVTRPHYMAKGGFAQPQRMASGGVAGGLQSLISRLDGMGFSHGSTTGGQHAPNSYHYKGEAVDFGDASNNMRRLWSVVYPERRKFAELFGPNYLTPKPTLQHYGAGFSDPALQAEHNDHIHIAYTGGSGPGFTARAAGRAGRAGPAFHGMPRVRFPRGLGALSSIGQGAMDLARRGANRFIRGHMGGGVGGAGGLSGGTSGANQKLGHQMMLSHGWGENQWPSLKALWTRESGWNQNARNPSSGAYGIPQALGHGNVFGSNPRDQIQWGLNYIKGRYGSPSAAYGHEQSAGWYSGGGFVGSGLTSQIGAITGGGPSANGPAPAKGPARRKHPKPQIATPDRVTWGTDPYTHKYMQHTNAQWAAIRAKFAAAKKVAAKNKKTPGFNAATGKEEFHTAEQWKQISIRHQVAQAKKARDAQRKARRQAAKTRRTDRVDARLAYFDSEVRAGTISLDEANAQKRTLLEGVLGGSRGHLSNAERLTFQGDLYDLGAGKDSLGHQVDLPANLRPPADPGEGPIGAVTTALNEVDEHQAAGDYGDPNSQEATTAANAAKHGIISGALAAGNLSAADTLSLRAQDYPLTHDPAAEQAKVDLAAALKDLKESIDRQNNFAAQVTSVSLGEAWRALSDVISGQITGVGYQGKAALAGSGNVARY